jgi:HSP20 family protein
MIIYFDEISMHLSMAIELYDKPPVSEIRNVGNDGVGSSVSSKKRKGISKYNRPQITSDPLAEVNVCDKELKVVLEMPGVSKEHMNIQAYKNAAEVSRSSANKISSY